MNIKIKKTVNLLIISLTLFLSCLTSNAFAQNEEAQDIVDEIFAAEVKLEGEDREYAHVWFNQIFGSFIFSPWDDQYENGTVTLVSKAIGFTNILALILGVVIISYVLFGGMLNTANHGEALGKDWSTMWLPIRTSLGFFLISPVTAIGGGALSFAQMLIIWLIMIGSNAATVLWNGILDEISNGTTVNAPDIRVGIRPTMDIASMLMCTEYYIRNKGDSAEISNNDNNIVAEVISADGKSIIYATFFDESLGKMRMKNANLSGLASGSVREIRFANSGACGSITFNYDHNIETESEVVASDYKIIAMNRGYDKAAEITIGTIQALIPAITDLTDYGRGPEAINQAIRSEDPSDLKNTFTSSASRIENAAISFSSRLVPEIHSAIINSNEINDQFKSTMQKGGWAKAGVWFYEIGAIPSLSYKVYGNVVKGISKDEPYQCSFIGKWFSTDECDEIVAEYSEAKLTLKNITNRIVSNNKGVSGSHVLPEDEVGLSESAASSENSHRQVVERLSTRVSTGILNVLANGSLDGPVGSSNGLSSPFETVTSIGHTMNVGAQWFWAAGAAMSTAAGAMTGASEGTGPAGGILGGAAGLVRWLAGTVVVAIGGLLGAGFVLAYVIPFMPIITWTMMMVGYLITVVEAVIAAPLAIILMVTPEGEGIAGTRLERSMQLLAMAILKPSLMIMGLVTAITVAAVGFAILNEFFFLTAQYQLHGSIIDFIPVMLIYMSASLNMCKMLIGLMHNLPNQILDWFSSGTGRSFGEHESSEAAMSSMGDVKGVAGGMTKMLGDNIKASKAKRTTKNSTSMNELRHKELLDKLN